MFSCRFKKTTGIWSSDHLPIVCGSQSKHHLQCQTDPTFMLDVDIQARTQHQRGILVFHCALLMCPSGSDCQQRAPLKHPEAFLGDESAQTTLNLCTRSLHMLFLATSKIFADFWACWSDSCSFIISPKVNFLLKGSCLACGQNRTS